MAVAPSDLMESASLPLLQRSTIKTIAVFRALQLGDMLCAVPALRAMRVALPDAHVTLVGLPWAEQFVSRFHRYVDGFAVFPGHPAFPEQPVQACLLPSFYASMRTRCFDLVVQLHGSGQISNQVVRDFGAKAVAGYVPKATREPAAPFFLDYPESGVEPVRLLRLVEYLGAPQTGAELEFPLTQDDERELNASRLNAGLVPGEYICVHPGARIRDKCWSPWRFAEVADRLADEFDVTVVLTGSAKEADLAAAVADNMHNTSINAAAPISIGAMAALMNGARLLICNDTGVSHMAAGLKLPSVVIFSKADIHRWSPLDQERHRCIWDPEGTQATAVLRHARELLVQYPSRFAA